MPSNAGAIISRSTEGRLGRLSAADQQRRALDAQAASGLLEQLQAGYVAAGQSGTQAGTAAGQTAASTFNNIIDQIAGDRRQAEALKAEVTERAAQREFQAKESGLAREQRAGFAEVRARLGEPGVSQRVARMALHLAA